MQIFLWKLEAFPFLYKPINKLYKPIKAPHQLTYIGCVWFCYTQSKPTEIIPLTWVSRWAAFTTWHNHGTALEPHGWDSRGRDALCLPFPAMLGCQLDPVPWTYQATGGRRWRYSHCFSGGGLLWVALLDDHCRIHQTSIQEVNGTFLWFIGHNI